MFDMRADRFGIPGRPTSFRRGADREARPSTTGSAGDRRSPSWSSVPRPGSDPASGGHQSGVCVASAVTFRRSGLLQAIAANMASAPTATHTASWTAPEVFIETPASSLNRYAP